MEQFTLREAESLVKEYVLYEDIVELAKKVTSDDKEDNYQTNFKRLKFVY